MIELCSWWEMNRIHLNLLIPCYFFWPVDFVFLNYQNWTNRHIQWKICDLFKDSGSVNLLLKEDTVRRFVWNDQMIHFHIIHAYSSINSKAQTLEFYSIKLELSLLPPKIRIMAVKTVILRFVLSNQCNMFHRWVSEVIKLTCVLFLEQYFVSKEI